MRKSIKAQPFLVEIIIRLKRILEGIQWSLSYYLHSVLEYHSDSLKNLSRSSMIELDELNQVMLAIFCCTNPLCWRHKSSWSTHYYLISTYIDNVLIYL